MYCKILAGAAASALLCQSAFAEDGIGRSAQIISVGQANRNARARGGIAAKPPKQGASTAASTNTPDQFRLHDLSRRWVHFQMAQDFNQPRIFKETGTDTSLLPASPTDNIAIPDWMRGVAPMSAPIFPLTPGCNSLPYRATGFLRLEAESRRRSYYDLMSQTACEHGIPAGLFDAMIIQESRYNPLALSSKRAFGLTQLMPATAAHMGVNRFDVVDNLRGGARYLRSHLDRFGRVDLALAAYNAGPGRVRNSRVPAIVETQAYVSSILNYWSRLSRTAGARNVAPYVEHRVQRVAVSSAF